MKETKICLGIVLFATFALNFAQAQSNLTQAKTITSSQAFDHPKANGLERGEAKRRALELTMAQNRLTADQKQVSNLTTKLAAATDAKVKANLQKQLTQTQNRVPQDQAAMTRAQSRVSDWTSTTAKVHRGSSVDWSTGAVSK